MRRRRRFVTAALSTATLSAATARAQICLSVAEPEHIPCWRRDEAIGPQLTDAQLLESARCYEQEEGNLEQALQRYEQYLQRTAGQAGDRDARNRIRWKIRRIRLLLGKDEIPTHRQGATPTASSVEHPPPKPVEVLPEPARSTAPRSGGAASCGCATAGGSSAGGVAVSVALALAAMARRRRGKDEGQ